MQRIRILAILALVASVSQTAAGLSVKEARMGLMQASLDYLAIPYLWGGQNPQMGLDCSAFVQLLYRKAGLSLPRVSTEQYQVTQYLGPDETLPGDLVFFAMKSTWKGVDHVGLYLGKGFFIHASYSQGVHIDHLTNPYYLARLVSIRKFKGF